MARSSGLKLGMQADTMPTEGSTDDQMATGPIIHVISVAEAKTPR